jgi:hypothetical protein
MKRIAVNTYAHKTNKLQPLMLSLSAVTLGLSSLFFSYNLLAEESLDTKSSQNYQQSEFSQAELEQMLAPIALYPDSVLTHILIASTYPIEIIQASRWLEKNSDLDASDALEAVEDKEWDPSVKALVAFPRVLERLSNDLEWTQNLGDAFLQDEKSVLASIQSLRMRADQAGNLDKMDNMKVSRENKTIIIQSAEPEIIYVPYYDTRVVYGNWHWVHHQPVYWDWSWHNSHNHYGHHYTPHYGLFSWHPRIHLRHHYYFSAFNWHNHHVVVVNGRHFNSRRYRHRSDIIAHADARRWDHNPKHRRGVAYRNNQVRERFSSTRPSRIETRAVRSSERNDVRASSSVSTPNTRSNQVRANNSERRTGNQNAEREQTSRNEHSTRSQRLREQLNNDQNTRNPQRNNDYSRTNQRESNVIRNDTRETNQPRQSGESRQGNSRQVQQPPPVRESRPIKEVEPVRVESQHREVRPQREHRADKESRSRSQRSSRPVRESRSRNDGRRSRGDRH